MMIYLQWLVWALVYYLVLSAFFSIAEYVKGILKTVERIERLLHRSIGGVAHYAEFHTIIDGQSRKVTHMFLLITQELPVSVVFKDKLGNVAKVDGLPAWAVTDATLASLEVAADGLSAVVTPLGPVGSFKLQVSADADLGEGVKSILGELSVDLLPAEAVTVELTPGTPVDVA